MKWYKLIAPAAIGVTVGTLVGKKVRDKYLFPEKVLKQVKNSLKQDGPISGSWILMEVKDYTVDGQTIKAYQGGVTRLENGENTQYLFHVNAENGDIIDLEKL
ncbi:peptidase M4 [Aquisalibacillus elongatus]|uniref:Putative small secreted protein n=1 Tax=Aquisalibacillus elongatus TaxID=485577 RepID=A0A3N5C782_9BACI|nr:peptidase M4 [Aquisalibacillus elongatus]RPF55312.1 putative small secreted protein [Aquisalibacillus elongatus]